MSSAHMRQSSDSVAADTADVAAVAHSTDSGCPAVDHTAAVDRSAAVPSAGVVAVAA